MAQSIQEVAVAIGLAEAKRGVFETNNDNRGPDVDAYAALASMPVGLAWCAMFVFFCYERAAAQLRVKNPMPRIFGAAQLEAWGVAQKKTVLTPVAGDILIKEHRHAGLVTGPPVAGGTFPSVEGNTWAHSDAAHRHEGVYVLNNEKVTKCTFIRIV